MPDHLAPFHSISNRSCESAVGTAQVQQQLGLVFDSSNYRAFSRHVPGVLGAIVRGPGGWRGAFPGLKPMMIPQEMRQTAEGNTIKKEKQAHAIPSWGVQGQRMRRLAKGG